jgi:urocanate hydratase
MSSGAQNTAAYEPVRSPRGVAISCRGWQQEGLMRMLLNSLDPDVAERPQDLRIGGAAGRAAADWEAFRAIAESLRQLGNEESLMVKSGKPAGVFPTRADSPRVLAINGAEGEAFGDWLHAGTQNSLPVLSELYAAVARRHFHGTLYGEFVLGCGLGGFGGAQPLAGVLNGAAFLGIEADPERIKRRVKSGYCEVMVSDLNEALRIIKNAVRKGAPASVGLAGNCADVLPETAARGVVPSVVTDCTPSRSPFDGYVASDQQGPDSASNQLRGMRELQRLGSLVIGAGDNFTKPRDYLQPMGAEGWRLATWMALSGEPDDVTRADRLALEMFSGDQRLTRSVELAAKYVRFQGLPARVAWMMQLQLSKLAVALNERVARGEMAAPILLGCRAPIAGSQTNPSTQFANVPAKDLLSMLSGSSWAWIDWEDPPRPAAQAVVADGSPEAGERFARWFEVPGTASPDT